MANLKVIEHNHHLSLETRLEAVKMMAENVVAANNKIKTQDTEHSIIILRKELGKSIYIIHSLLENCYCLALLYCLALCD